MSTSYSNDLDTELLQKVASLLRFRVVRTSYLTGTPHLGSCLSCIDLLVYFYWKVLRIDRETPLAPDRDRFILSKGHAAPALFQVLAERGFFPLKDLEHYGEDGSLFGEHPPNPAHLPGIEAATGSLGHGLSMGLGMALSSRVLGLPFQVFVVMSDGECNEGAIWEAALLGAAQKVSNLTIAIDYNKWQATGRSNEVMALAPLVEKWKSFGWCAIEVDGHDFSQIDAAVKAHVNDLRPKVIVANTIKGRGVSFMEDDNNWHYRIPTAEEVRHAAAQLGIAANQVCIDDRKPINHG